MIIVIVMLEKYEKAGKIAADVRKRAVKKATAGMKVINLIEWIENEIKKTGAELSFPCNISINQIAAHYTSPPGDNTILCEGDIVKIDLGAEVDGYVSDTAITTIITGNNETDDENNNAEMPGRLDGGNPTVTQEEVEERQEIIEASACALENVISIIKDGVSLEDIGRVVQETIHSQGYVPIVNLSGHSLQQNKLHAGLSIPNFPEKNSIILKEGDCVAIEPFATNGIGIVSDLPQHHIYSYLRDRPLRQENSQQLLKMIQEKHTYFPFAKRHLLENYTQQQLDEAIDPLISSRAIYPYKTLKEKSDGMVAQTEHTIIVEKDGCKITTL